MKKMSSKNCTMQLMEKWQMRRRECVVMVKINKKGHCCNNGYHTGNLCNKNTHINTVLHALDLSLEPYFTIIIEKFN